MPSVSGGQRGQLRWEGQSGLSEEETGAGPPGEGLACQQCGTGPGARLNLLLPWEDAELERVTKGLPASP